MSDTHATADRATQWNEALTRYLPVNGETLAYRDLGVDGGTPIVLLTHLGATLDEWDPRVVDALAAGRRVIAIELPGVGGSTGKVPSTIKGMADVARAFIAALGLTHIDLMGFSLGGFIAQQVTLDNPSLVRRLVLAGTGPAGGHGINRPTGAAYVYVDMLRGVLARTDAKEFLFSRVHLPAKPQLVTILPEFMNASWIEIHLSRSAPFAGNSPQSRRGVARSHRT